MVAKTEYPQFDFKYVYGPIYSWRLGMSVGIDPLGGDEKICNFDCTYCQLGRTKKLYEKRDEFIPVSSIIDEIKLLPSRRFNYITFSGRGEPTLASNLGRMIQEVRRWRPEKIAVITNSALIHQWDVAKDLMKADLVVAKLDGYSQDSFGQVNHPASSIDFHRMMLGVWNFRRRFQGKLALQMMFVKQNKKYAAEMAELAKAIKPHEVQINTPTRACAVKMLSKRDMDKIKEQFKGLPVVSVYDAATSEVEPWDKKKTIIRHGGVAKSRLT
jgi:wyosine [tRNA(Phe)-imidazoG37] synthetase (radical SAM superfamily)